MKHTFTAVILLSALMLTIPEITNAQPANMTDAHNVANNYLNFRHPNQVARASEPILSGNDTLAWLFHCQPRGFVIISTSTYLPPVIAWSEEANFGEGEAWTRFLPIFLQDLKLRKQLACQQDIKAARNREKWNFWMDPGKESKLFEQWPPAGWSSTGGWLFTNWTQSSPYNALCPIDGQTQLRSVAGCPATAMAQIVNFHHNTHETRFTDADDYYHHFGSGNSYWIDDDWEARGFPSWDQLNTYLDTLDAHYLDGVELTPNDKAALTYACGMAAKQVYSSSVSGTYGINQAYDAYMRFGYTDVQLVYPSNPELNNMLAENIKIALPAQLGLVNPTETAGHNVVVDGYNTDEMYHFNFGWGGSANGWYTMPPQSIPYNLTVIEGIVLDINLSNPPVGTAEKPKLFNHTWMNYCHETGILDIRCPEKTGTFQLCVFNSTGRRMMQEKVKVNDGLQSSGVSMMHLPIGVYIATLRTEYGFSSVCKFAR